MSTHYLSDGSIITLCHNRIDPTIKTAYIMRHGVIVKRYSGDSDGRLAWIKHESALANKREARSMIADMCGTSYSAACADMGMNKF